MTEIYSFRERLNRFETAQETIGFMMAIVRAQVEKARSGGAPGNAEVMRLQAKFNRLDDELHALRPTDHSHVQRILDVYAPLVKRYFESGELGMTLSA